MRRVKLTITESRCRSGYALVAGRYPLFANGKIVGGIGIGEGTEEQDCEIAEYVVSVFEKLVR